jgi:hypothetical protein
LACLAWLAMPPFVPKNQLEIITVMLIRCALPLGLSETVVAVQSEEHTYVDRSDGKKTKKVPVSADYLNTRTLVYLTE